MGSGGLSQGAKYLDEKHRVIEILSTGQRDRQYIAERFEQLRKEYPDEYIAVYKGKLIGRGKLLRGLLDSLRKQGVNVARVTIEYIPSEEIVAIIQ